MPADLAAGGPLRVLAVDDSRDNADSVALLVRLWGHDCRACYGGAEALAVAAEYRPDVVFSNIGMPGMDGLELARRLSAFGDARPALYAMSGFTDAARRRAADAAGFDLYLAKPADPAELQKLLDQSARLRRACLRLRALAERTERLQRESLELLAEIKSKVSGRGGTRTHTSLRDRGF